MNSSRGVFLGALLLLAVPVYGGEDTLCRVTAHFSGEGSIGRGLAQALGQAKERVTLALFAFDNMRLADELAKLARNGVLVRLKVDASKDRKKKTGMVIDFLKAAGVKVQVVAPERKNHNKFAVIDGKRVITGSYNWTLKAEQNWENLLFLDCPELAEKYEQEWERIR